MCYFLYEDPVSASTWSTEPTTWSSHLVTCPTVHLVTQSPGHLVTWSPGHLATCPFSLLDATLVIH